MQFTQYFYLRTVKYDFINKFLYEKTKEIPHFKKVILDFQCKSNDLKLLVTCLLALELISKQKSVMTLANSSNILLKIRKGDPVGCKITLRKNYLPSYLLRDLVQIFPRFKNFKGFEGEKLKKNTFSYQIMDSFDFQTLESNYYLFNNLPKLKVTLITTSRTKQELKFLLRSLKIPVLKALITQLVECNLAKIKVKGSNPFIC